MATKLLVPKGSSRNDFLYAMLLIAGISATLFSVVGIAIITGLITPSFPNAAQRWGALPAPSILLLAEPSLANTAGAVSGACDNCDTIKQGQITRPLSGPRP